MVYREYCIGEDDYDAERELHFRKRTLSRCVSQMGPESRKDCGCDDTESAYAAKMKKRYDAVTEQVLISEIANQK